MTESILKTSPTAIRQSTTMRIKKGQHVVCQGRAVKVLAIVSATQIWVNYLGTEEHDWVSLEVLAPYVDQNPRTQTKTKNLSENNFEFERADKWVEVLERYKDCTALTPEQKQAIAKELDASRRTVERHFALYQLDPSPRGQLPFKPGPEPGSNILVKPIVAIIDKAIAERYSTEERGSIQSVVDLARPRCVAAGSGHRAFKSLPMPAWARRRFFSHSPRSIPSRRRSTIP